MPPKQFPFILDGIHGDVPNGFYPASDSERGVILHPYPGLVELCQLPSSTVVRGLYSYNNYMYALAVRGTDTILWRIDPSGGFAEVGTITTSDEGPIWITNNATQICIVDGVTGYTFTPATNVFVQISDPDFPGAGGVDFQDGYGLFFKPNSNQWFFSSLYDFTQFDALDFYSKESRPDNIVGLVSFLREPWIFGPSAVEVWYNAGGDNSSPNNPTFARNTGGIVPYGLGASGSILPENQSNPRTSLRWLTNQGQVAHAVSYAAKVISNQMFDRATADFSTFADCIAFEYRSGGHEFTQYNFPTGDQTWVWDEVTKAWSKRQSYLDDGSGWGRHRANCYTLHNGKHYVGDYINGKIYEMTDSAYDDDGHEVERILYSKEVDGGMERISFPSVQLLCEAGVGTPGGDNPQIMLDFSADGGNTWSNKVQQGAGIAGDYGRRAQWHQMGSGYKRMYRFTFTDPVLWRILGADFGF